MFLKFLFFGLLCYYFDGVQGLKGEVQSTVIAHRHLFVGDIIEVSITDLRVVNPEQSKDELMMISVMKDKTLGYELDPFFPYTKQRKPVLDLNAAENNRDFILSASTVALKIDFAKKTLINHPSFSMITLYPNISSIVRDNSSIGTLTEQIIEMTSSELNGTVLYNLTFAFRIDTAESQGLYKIYLHSYSNIEMSVKISMPSQNVSERLYAVIFLLWPFIFFWISVYSCWVYFRRNVVLVGKTAFAAFHLALMRTFFTGCMLSLTTSRAYSNFDTDCVIFVTISTQVIFAFFTIFICVSHWKHQNIRGFFHKTDKVFHIFLWLGMTHYSLLNSCTAMDYFIYPVTMMMNNGFVGMIINDIIYLLSTMVILVTTTRELTNGVLILGFRQRYWRTRLIFGGYFFAVSFNLDLAIMTSLSFPFYFHFLQIALEDISTVVLPLWIFYECLRYHRYVNHNPQNLAAGA